MGAAGGNPGPPIATIELMPTDTMWQVTGTGTIYENEGKVTISVIKIGTGGQEKANLFQKGFYPLWSGSPKQMKLLWKQIEARAKAYKYAEQDGFSAPKNLPNSIYGDPRHELLPSIRSGLSRESEEYSQE